MKDQARAGEHDFQWPQCATCLRRSADVRHVCSECVRAEVSLALRSVRLVLDELVGAVRDAERRYAAGDTRALESNMLSATLKQAESELERKL